MDSGGTTGAVAIVCAVLALAGAAYTARQSRQAQRDSQRVPTFEAITKRLDAELITERTQRRLLSSYVLDLLRWARGLPPEVPPPPEPPEELDLSPWR